MTVPPNNALQLPRHCWAWLSVVLSGNTNRCVSRRRRRSVAQLNADPLGGDGQSAPEMTRALYLVVVLLSLSFAVPEAIASDVLCTPRPPPADGGDDFAMAEGEFNFEHAVRSLAFLRDEFPGLVCDRARQKTLCDMPSFYVGYPNSLKFVEGVLLKQQALLDRAKRDLVAQEPVKNPSKAADMTAAEAKFAQSKARFCNFLGTADYAD